MTTGPNKKYFKMEFPHDKKTNVENQCTVVSHFDDNYSCSIVDDNEKCIKVEIDETEEYTCESAIEIPKATDQSTILMSLKDGQCPPSNFFLDYGITYQEHTIFCVICGDIFPSLINLHRHLKSHGKITEDSQKTIKCHWCGKLFLLKVYFKQHKEKCDKFKKNIRNTSIHEEAVPNKKMTHDNDCMDTTTYENVEESNSTSKNETSDPKYLVEHSNDRSDQEKFLNNLGLVTMPVYESLVKNLAEKDAMRCTRCYNIFDDQKIYDRHITRCRKHLYEKMIVHNNTFACKVCKLHFTDSSSLKNHILKDCDDRVCPCCKATFDSKALWFKHIIFYKSHNFCLSPNSKFNKTNDSNNVENTRSSTLMKKESTHSIEETDVKQESNNLDIDVEHSADEKRNSTVQLKCTDCGLSVSNTHALALHLAASHENYSMNKCLVCHQHFKKIIPWKNHMMNHQQQLERIMAQGKSSELAINSKIYLQFQDYHAKIDNINNLIETTTEPKPAYSPKVIEMDLEDKNQCKKQKIKKTSTFSCKSCDKSYKRKCDLSRHVKIKHKIQVNTSPIVSDVIESSIKEESKAFYQCNHCLKQYVYLKSFSKHLLREHSDDDTLYKCKHCNKSFSANNYLTSHVKFCKRLLENKQLLAQNDSPGTLINPGVSNVLTKNNTKLAVELQNSPESASTQISKNNSDDIDVKPFQFHCLLCNETCNCPLDWQKHLNFTHSTIDATNLYTQDKYGFHCRACDRRYIRKGNFDRHYKHNHLNMFSINASQAQHTQNEYDSKDGIEPFPTNLNSAMLVKNKDNP